MTKEYPLPKVYIVRDGMTQKIHSVHSTIEKANNSCLKLKEKNYKNLYINIWDIK